MSITKLAKKRVRAPKTQEELETKKIIQIYLDTEQKIPAKLKYCFDLPNQLNTLLHESPQPLQDIQLAKIWLLSRWKDLSLIVQIADRNRAIDALTRFLPFWLEHRKPITRVTIPAGCSITADSKFIYLGKEIGLLAVKDSNALKITQQNWKMYSRAFDLIKDGNIYSVEVSAILNQQKNPTPNLIDDSHSFAMGLDSHKLFKALELLLTYQDKLDRTYSRPDFNKLEGRPVPGGLPGSGKRK